jgi:L-alanine-DL-glutamate epimerase-like enolase superfamily enzyme
MKVGSPDHSADLARLRAVHQAVPEAIFRVDANQAFTAGTALDFIRQALDAGVRLELVEQPVAKEDVAALDAVAASSPVPIFADEAIKSPADALRLVRETRVQGINVKLMKAGVSGALDIIAIARAAGRKLMIGCMLETRRGIGFALALACGTGAFDYVDLDSHRFIHEDGENPYFTEDGPFLSVAR